MKLNWQDIITLLALAFVLGWLIPHGSHSPANAITEKEVIKERVDTVLSIVEVPIPSLHTIGEQNHSKTITLHDTLYREACFDTLLKTDTTGIAPDTLSVCYARDLFSVALALSPRRENIKVPYIAHDTFLWRDNEEQFREGTQPWYDALFGVLIALAAGIVIGKL